MGFWCNLMIFGIGEGEIWRVTVPGGAGKGVVVVGFGDGSVGMIPVLKNSR